MPTLKRHLLRIFLPKILANACPATIPRSGEEGEKVNCFYVHQSKGDEPYLVFIGIKSGTVDALEFDGDRYALERSLSLEEIDPSSLEISHYYGLSTITYQGILDFAIGRTLRFPYIKLALNSFLGVCAQSVFNRRSLVVRQRLDLLRDVVKMAQGGHSAISPLNLMTEKYGYRWAGHPDWEAHSATIQFYLDGLVDTGELKKNKS